MSPQLARMDAIARMQNVLRDVRDLSNDVQRSAAYIAADISDLDQHFYDAEARRTEQIRREVVCAGKVGEAA